jgi:Arc/MetJ-type ribon-helix-helix transcriptional regulator
MKNYTFRLTDTLLDDLQEHADRKGATVSDFIRATLTDALTGNAKMQTDKSEHDRTRKLLEETGVLLMDSHTTTQKKLDGLIASFSGYLTHQAANGQGATR